MAARKPVTMFDVAEQDFQYLSANVEDGNNFNAMCITAQTTCEKYLKMLLTGTLI